jgi:hypothetical protein
MRRPLYVRTTGKRAGRPIVPRVRVTGRARQVTGEARREIEERLRREGILPRVERRTELTNV